MTASPRQCFYVPEDQRDENGYIPSLVTEHVAGHSPLTGNGEHAVPWYWGKSLDEAKAVAARENARLGLSEKDVIDIVMSSMLADNAGPQYPEPGSAIPDQPGFVVGHCSHRVARSEWCAGFRNCERCGESGQPFTWQVQEPAVGKGGDVGGDYQAGEAWSVRLLSEQVPGSLITVYVFAEALRVNHGQGEMPSGEYGVTVMTEYLTCTDVSDLGGTETWSDMKYDYEADPLAYDSAEEADEAAKKLAGIYAANPSRFQWDGRQFRD